MTEDNSHSEPLSNEIYRSDVMDAVLGPRRRRRDRYFGCSLSIAGGASTQPSNIQASTLFQEAEDSDDDLFYSPGFTKKRKNASNTQGGGDSTE